MIRHGNNKSTETRSLDGSEVRRVAVEVGRTDQEQLWNLAREERWSSRVSPVGMDFEQAPVGFIANGTVPKDILTALCEMHSDGGTVSSETSLRNIPPSSFEIWDGTRFPSERLAGAAMISLRHRALADWAAWVRWMAERVLGVEVVVPAVAADGTPFPTAIRRETSKGILPHVDSAPDEYPRSELDVPGTVFSVITYLTTHPHDEGELLVYDARPLEGGNSTISYPLEVSAYEGRPMARIQALKGRTAIVKSSHCHEVLPTTVPRQMVTSFVLVSPDGRTAVQYA